jgi:acyl carrier protein
VPSFEDVKALLGDVLQLGPRAARFAPSTPLLGSVPEFDSMAVVSVLTAAEERFGIQVEDDEVTAQTFETVGNLYDFICSKVGG